MEWILINWNSGTERWGSNMTNDSTCKISLAYCGTDGNSDCVGARFVFQNKIGTSDNSERGYSSGP
jgi:hypothetical protein